MTPFALCPFIDLKDTAEELRAVFDAIAIERFDTVDDALTSMEKVEPNFPKQGSQPVNLRSPIPLGRYLGAIDRLITLEIKLGCEGDWE
jgi:hypothetical protein